jgi:2-polyprenyl-3-methyl-5-hydroxy-6-metoxy-1,4-benzoquinol methylase
VVIEDAILTCPACHRWFPVINGIPVLVPDGLRNERQELALLRKYEAAIPPAILSEGYPLNLANRQSVARTQEEQHARDEAHYWGEFFHAFAAIGDTSILDVRQKGTHPAYYNRGVLELDERDKTRRYGVWPDHLGKKMFGPLVQFGGKRALDIGCGGGQFGLEAAYQGIDVVGIDISHGALSVAANHAATVGQEIQYVCADPMYPPFHSNCFDLLLSKDALHHLNDPHAALDRLCRTLRPDGHLLAYEHVGNSRLVNAIIETCARVLIPRIERRYPRVSIAPVFQCPSVLEDVGILRVTDAMRSFFQPIMEYGELMLYFELEQLVYYAFGKRRGIASLVRNLTFAIEKLLLLFISPEHLSFFGQRKPPANK